MKLRFCGEDDCPDWVLAEITTLSRLSSVKLRLLGQLVAHSITHPPFDVEKAEKLLQESKLDKQVDLKTCTACLTFILESATSFNCDAGIFSSELQQLGLPREHSQSIRKVYTDNRSQLAETLCSRSLKVFRLKAVSAQCNSASRCVSLQLQIDGASRKINVPQEMAEQMLAEMLVVTNVMNEYNMIDHVI